jgi:hypothetical protein
MNRAAIVFRPKGLGSIIMTRPTGNRGTIEPMEPRTLLSVATGVGYARQFVRLTAFVERVDARQLAVASAAGQAGATAPCAPRQASLDQPGTTGMTTLSVAASAAVDAKPGSLGRSGVVQRSAGTVDRAAHSDDGTFAPHWLEHGEHDGHDGDESANGSTTGLRKSLSLHSDAHVEADDAQIDKASATGSLGIEITEFVITNERDVSVARVSSALTQAATSSAASPAVAARAAKDAATTVADAATSATLATARTVLATAGAVVAEQLAPLSAASAAHKTSVLDAPVVATNAVAPAAATGSALVRRAAAAVSPFSAVALDDVASPAAVDPAALATVAGTVARSFAVAAPAVQRTMSDALAFMLATPRAFHVERMGSPLTLLADSVAAFAEESASIPLASLGPDALYAAPAAEAASTTQLSRAWTITAAVIAADAALFAYLYHRSGTGRRPRRRA